MEATRKKKRRIAFSRRDGEGIELNGVTIMLKSKGGKGGRRYTVVVTSENEFRLRFLDKNGIDKGRQS